MAKCTTCKGTGAVECPQCNGKGRKGGGGFSSSYECSNCKGSGKKTCSVCNGKGINDPFLLSATLSTSARSLFTFANTFKNHLIFLQPNDG